MNISGIYKIQSKSKSERIYIGSTVDFGKRWEVHLRELKNNKHHSVKLQRHYNKYGITDLQFSILLGCPKEDLIKTEQYFLDSYNPYFNSCKIAGNPIEFKLSEEARKKISNSKLGSKNHNYGKHLSKETREKISKKNTGKVSAFKGGHHTEETKKILSDLKIGKPHPHPGYPVSAEHRMNLSKALKGRIPWNKGKPYPHPGYIHTEEQKQKVRKSMMGKTHTEEYKKRMSEMKKEFYRKKRELLVINQN